MNIIGNRKLTATIKGNIPELTVYRRFNKINNVETRFLCNFENTIVRTKTKTAIIINDYILQYEPYVLSIPSTIITMK